ncbi:MAG: methionine--tRNA ligase [Kiritimatiellae bacterium]|nr:methionine--tRNA ligase [Kiritimatiellia bacterium]
MSNFYVTTPIYYVNDKPHIGHAYTTILADVLARYHRLAGDETMFLTGTDEHGQKVQQAAEAGGISPQEHADHTVVRFQELWERLEVTHDDFIRTTEERHRTIVQKILQDLYDRDEIYAADYDGWYDVTSETFVTEKDFDPERASGSKPSIIRIQERNSFFRMSKYKDWLVDYIETNPGFIQPDFRRNETLGFLKKDLTDLCISRPKNRLSWGIELPFDDQFVTYVWFDALVNYISAVGYQSDDERFQKWWPASYHLIGKDILTTHTVYWPTMLKAMGLPMPESIFAHGWWLMGKDKMSKSTGNVVDPMVLSETYGVDAFRYYLMAEMSLGQDAAFSEASFIRRYNTDLANDLGNMLSRVLKLICANCDGRIPEPVAPGDAEAGLREACLAAAEGMLASVRDMRLDKGLAGLAGIVRETNRYLEVKQPWTMAKTGETEAFNTVMYYAAEALRIVSGMLHPVMPDKMSALRVALGLGDEAPAYESLAEWGVLVPGQAVEKPESLFPRIQVEKATASKQSTKATSKQAKPAQAAEAAPEGVATIAYTDFTKVELKTARIVEAEKVEGADRLLYLRVDVAGESRQIVAGIAEHYKPEELPGKTVVMVANLAPAKIRGLKSEGMLLAASEGDQLRLVSIDGDLPSGASVR